MAILNPSGETPQADIDEAKKIDEAIIEQMKLLPKQDKACSLYLRTDGENVYLWGDGSQNNLSNAFYSMMRTRPALRQAVLTAAQNTMKEITHSQRVKQSIMNKNLNK